MFSNKVFVTRRPNWPQMFSGESITLTCEVQGGETTEWTCEWRTSGSIIHKTDSKDWTFNVSESSSGNYMCQCRSRDDWYSSTQWSETITLSVSTKPGAKLSAGSSTIPVGGSVTLSCSVEPSAGWKYRWFRRTSDSSFVEFSRNNEENREITVTQGGIYKCDGERGNPSLYSHSSLENIIEIMFSNKVFVTRQPNWPQMFSGESITLTCEVQGGETTEWTCEWRRSGSIIQWTDSKDWTFNVSESSSGNYTCQCRSRDDWYSSTQWSETIRLSVSSAKPRAKLAAGSSTIPVGGSVTLSCSVEPSAGWKYRWFRRTSDSSFVEFSRNNEENREITVTQGGIYKCDGKRGNPSFYSHSSLENIIEIMFSNKVFVTRQPNWPHIFSGESITLTCEVQGGETTEWTCDWRRSGSIIHKTDNKDWTFNVSESSSGNYMCQCRSRDDWYSSTQWSETITVTVSSPVISSFPVMLIVGPVSGIVLIVLLLLLWRCRRSKDLSCIRSFQSESSSQRPTTNHGVNQTESDYSFLLHGTTSVYETIHNRGATGKERPPDPEEGSVYVNVRPDNYSSA
ncbi:leukocyte immunoglobulin-like receptor subfamily B member 3A [Xiphophorus maculatus]|uniref:leukocyte immunoglobulin-like receptor subfamily B member 3A n=1 Tax=Xiphophorus maculatus TaxID=8083 RepID=UPI000C6D3EF0|nr:leukocyte immunoglobulin-like receptor subfamily B member 3A [Xiphophorus maculatus]